MSYHGSCFCQKVKIEYTSETITAGLCHCLDCRKLTANPYSLCFVARFSELKVTGTPKELVKTADSGNVVKNYFCDYCGTPLYGGAVTKDGELDSIVIRAGIFDEQELLHRAAPVVEIYTSNRLRWLPPLEGCGQFEGMLPS
ncbi:unnamed protein product [Zymoseptoria tritici ST99CH_1E4]|uniref:CENP-V/GFA domain-containing protein n=1 Tax=Zymoseptoria tritici ST99CH_1E4 TaxID=1276532 RepID=A0A2H1GU27_ZYMTR|nr:unnamed protein product [Zymoseptoria tritici ST99CH_1E4]